MRSLPPSPALRRAASALRGLAQAPASRAALKRAAFGLLGLARVDLRLVETLGRQHATVVLSLHRVSTQPNPYWAPLHPRLLEELLRFLGEHFDVRGLRDDELAPTRSGRPRVVLSFDDGYYDFVEYVMPALNRFGFAANQNVIPGCVASGEPPWNVKIYDFLNAAPPSLLAELRLPGFAAPPPSKQAEARARYGAELSHFLKMRPRAERAPLWEQLAALMARLDFTPTRMMNEADVRQASGRHHLGAHSYEHDSMGFESDDFLARDVERCAAFFRDRLHLPLDAYAFPNGSFRPSQLDVLRAKGIKHILLVEEKLRAHGGDVYPRLTFSAESVAEVRLRAAGFRSRGVYQPTTPAKAAP
ncbi:MAG: polysaccharide deacetylase family protein [Polyangiaceae bacterium]|nr:polysaccharide deacetylase family protein [Polyangiaceae bacterium]